MKAIGTNLLALLNAHLQPQTKRAAVSFGGVRKAASARSLSLSDIRASLLRRINMEKSAQVAQRAGTQPYDVSTNKYKGYVDKMQADARARQAAQLAAAEKKRTWPATTGNSRLDNLPDVRRLREEAREKAIKEEWLSHQPDVVQKKDISTIQKEVDDNGGVSDFGNTGVGRAVGGMLADTVGRLAHLGGKTFGYYFAAPKGTTWSDWAKQYDKTQNALDPGRMNLAHDIASNFQLQAENVRDGFEQTGRFLGKWVDPKSWGWWRTQLEREKTRASHDNAAANANMASLERQRRIIGNFRDRNLAHPEKSTMGMLNYGANAAIGQFTGGTVATGGVGTAAKGTAGLVRAGTTAAATRAGGAAARATASLGRSATGRALISARNGVGRMASSTRNGISSAASRVGSSRPVRAVRGAFRGSAPHYSRHPVPTPSPAPVPPPAPAPVPPTPRVPISQRVGSAVERGIKEVGDTVLLPLDVAGKMHIPLANRGAIGAARPGLLGQARDALFPVQASEYAAAQSVRAAGRPLKHLGNTLFHPVNTYRNSVRPSLGYFRQHPFVGTGKTIAAPFRWAGDVARPVTGPIVPYIWRPHTLKQTTNDIAHGRPFSAGMDLVDAGVFGGAGFWPGTAWGAVRGLSGAYSDEEEE